MFPGKGATGHLIEPKKAWHKLLELSGLTDLRLHEPHPFRIDKDGTESALPPDTTIDSFGDGLIKCSQGGKFGYRTCAGKIAIPAIYDDVGYPSEGYVFVKSNGKWGILTSKGAEVVRPSLLSEDSPSITEGSAWLRNNDKYGLIINESGTFLIAPKFSSVGNFHEGLASVEIGGKSGFIDKTGEFVISPQYSYSDDFSEGFANVALGKTMFVSSGEGARWGFIDKRGRPLGPFRFYFAKPFQNGLALVAVKTLRGVRYGYINHRGLFVIPPKFLHAESFSEGLAAVWIRED